LGVVLAAAALACTPSGFTYIANSDLGSYLKLPDHWTVFDEEVVFARQTRELPSSVAEQVRQGQWAVAFDADPDPSIEHFFEQFRNPSAYPSGYLRIRALRSEEREEFSEASLRNELVRVDALRGADPSRVRALDSEEIDAGEGTRGVRTIVNFRVDKGVFTLDQSALVDENTEVIYLLAIGCEASCYEQHRSVIDEVADSWTIQGKIQEARP
jgi:hypothetical protein